MTDWSKQLLVALAQPVQAPYVHWKERQSTTRLYRQTGLDASGAMLEEHKSHPVERFVVSLCFKQTAILCDSLGECCFLPNKKEQAPQPSNWGACFVSCE